MPALLVGAGGPVRVTYRTHAGRGVVLAVARDDVAAVIRRLYLARIRADAYDRDEQVGAVFAREEDGRLSWWAHSDG